jgi:Fe-S cluster assembly scaffold protein SufB
MIPRSSKHPFTRESVEAFSKLRNEPAWLTELRLEAWARFEVLREESSLASTDFANYDAWLEPPTRTIPSDEWPVDLRHTMEERGDEEALIIQRDSTILSRAITKDSIKRGVIFTDLETAARTVPELVRPALGRQILLEDAWTALNAAFWTGGSFLYVPEHLTIDLPFHMCYWLTTACASVFPRTLIVIGNGSRVVFMDEFLSPDNDVPGLSSTVVEIQLQEKAQLDYVQLQNWGDRVDHVERLASEVSGAGTLRSWSVEMGGRDPRVCLKLAARSGDRQASEAVQAGEIDPTLPEEARFAATARFFDPLLARLPNDSVREKVRHYVVGKVTGHRRETTLQRASELHPEVRL